MRRTLSLLIVLTACGEDANTDAPAETETEGEVGPTPDGDGPTFFADVAPLLARHCRGCHGSGGIAPFALDDYDEAAALAPVIAAAVREQVMPPFHVGDDGSCNNYRESKRLTDDEIATFVDWADADAPAGIELPIPDPHPVPQLVAPAHTLEPDAAYEPTGALSDDYRCFVIDPGFDTDRFLTGYEVHPGAPSVVHHVVLFSIDTDAEAAAAAELDANAAGPGYPCYGGSETGGGRSLLVWTPGTGATLYPEGTGLRMLAGRGVIMQVHYFGGGVEDRTRIDLALADTVESEALITAAADVSVFIPAGESSYEQTAALPLPAWDQPMKIHAVYPHMHRYGTTLRVDYDRGDTSRCLVDVPDYDFDWQQFFFYDEPIVLDPPGGGHFRITCTFDTRGADGPGEFGDGTDDEMCIAALYATY